MELNEILKVGDHIYSILHGIECEVTRITPFDITLVTDTDIKFKVNCDGSFVNGGECIIFPSKENRNWNQVVPYNEETEYLRGTDKYCPEYYNFELYE